MRATAVAFDLDGTLVRLAVDIDAVRRRCSALFGPLGYHEAFSPILQRIEDAASAVATSPEHRAELVATARGYIAAAEVEAAAAAVACPGAATALACGVPFGIVTDNARACVRPALRAAHLAADIDDARIVSRDDVARPKPDVGGLALLAGRLLPSGGTLWVAGDSPRDVEAVARLRTQRPELDVRSVGVLGGRGTEQTLVAADHVIAELGALIELLRR